MNSILLHGTLKSLVQVPPDQVAEGRPLVLVVLRLLFFFRAILVWFNPSLEGVNTTRKNSKFSHAEGDGAARSQGGAHI